MRAFVVLCLVALASADHLGYNYRPVDQSYTPGGGNSGIGSGNNGNYGSSSNTIPSFGSVGSSPSFTGGSSGPSFGASNASPSIDSGNNAGPGFGDLGSASNSAPFEAPELEKEFITYTADEEDFVPPAASNQYSNSLKQGLRVIFIKGPENNGLEDAALALAKQAAEQHTAIYVLNKQTDLQDLSQKLNQITSNINNKPEVHFVKYRTPEDAANAQKAIQGEYDTLGGSSQHVDGGIAPALNFASRVPIAAAGPAGQQGGGSQYGPTTQYGSSSQHGPSGQYGSSSQHGPSSQYGSVGQHGGSVPHGSYGPQSTYGSQVLSGPRGSGSGPNGAGAGGPSSTYLPASIFRRFRF